MLAYLARRLLVMIPTLIAISAIVFFIINLPPGDFLTTMISELQAQGEPASLEKVRFLTEQFGLDRPAWEQYLHWVAGLVQGDLGWSFEFDIPVADVIGERVLLTIVVAVATTLFTYLVAFPIGIYSAVRQYSLGDYAMTFVGFIGLATPSFMLALILMYLANEWFGADIGGLMSPEFVDAPLSWAKVADIGQHLWIPMIIIGLASTAEMIRQLRANLLDELQKQYVVTGRAKGLPEGKLLRKYPLRMALNPFIADIGSILPKLISGSAVVSVVLSLPTNGPMLLRALFTKDMYLAGSFLMVEAVLVVVGIFLSDVALALLDPRIRLGASSER
jgi:peptide/nickel transport system permease protein